MSATYQVTPGDRTGETQSKSLPYWTLASGGRQTVNSSSSERHRGAVTHRDAPRTREGCWMTGRGFKMQGRDKCTRLGGRPRSQGRVEGGGLDHGATFKDLGFFL